MKSIYFSIFLCFVSIQVFAQKNELSVLKKIQTDTDGEENTLYSIPHYDSLGNLFQVRERFDHTPTHADSIVFAYCISTKIHKMMEEYGREQQEYYESIKTMNIQKKKQNPKRKRKIQK
jgi:hypothetical protein